MSETRASQWRAGPLLSDSLLNGRRMSPTGVYYLSQQYVTHTLHVKHAASPSIPMRRITSALMQQLRPKLLGSSSSMGFSASEDKCWVTLARDCASYAEVSNMLNNGGAYPLTLPGGAIVSVPITHRYQYVPSSARNILFFNIPPHFNVEELPQAVFNMAGYTVLFPDPHDLAVPTSPPPNHVTLLRFRPGKTKSGHANDATMVVTILTPLEDPFLRHLPPGFYVPEWDDVFLTLVENDPLPKVPRPSVRPEAHSLPDDLGEGWSMDTEDAWPPTMATISPEAREPPVADAPSTTAAAAAATPAAAPAITTAPVTTPAAVPRVAATPATAPMAETERTPPAVPALAASTATTPTAFPAAAATVVQTAPVAIPAGPAPPAAAPTAVLAVLATPAAALAAVPAVPAATEAAIAHATVRAVAAIHAAAPAALPEVASAPVAATTAVPSVVAPRVQADPAVQVAPPAVTAVTAPTPAASQVPLASYPVAIESVVARRASWSAARASKTHGAGATRHPIAEPPGLPSGVSVMDVFFMPGPPSFRSGYAPALPCTTRFASPANRHNVALPFPCTASPSHAGKQAMPAVGDPMPQAGCVSRLTALFEAPPPGPGQARQGEAVTGGCRSDHRVAPPPAAQSSGAPPGPPEARGHLPLPWRSPRLAAKKAMAEQAEGNRLSDSPVSGLAVGVGSGVGFGAAPPPLPPSRDPAQNSPSTVPHPPPPASAPAWRAKSGTTDTPPVSRTAYTPCDVLGAVLRQRAAPPAAPSLPPLPTPPAPNASPRLRRRGVDPYVAAMRANRRQWHLERTEVWGEDDRAVGVGHTRDRSATSSDAGSDDGRPRPRQRRPPGEWWRVVDTLFPPTASPRPSLRAPSPPSGTTSSPSRSRSRSRSPSHRTEAPPRCPPVAGRRR